MHKVADEVEQDISIPILHIVDATATEIQKKGYTKLGLIAARFSMEERFLKDRYYDKFGIETIVPFEEEQNDIHSIIYD